ncbi:YoaK family protein [Alicyclobacillus fastidiosus]|uniref:YoaK family protein n=1 Tax=Alicyclobacillus fastidiosus TaxID=392011 RepID=A0ABV5AB29_9BACL|nr:YoaK family protein [Alicyclobacillus fastidiosus]WEH10759.1 YoaK family protein [Alicyclobacillus fastidiosus]
MYSILLLLSGVGGYIDAFSCLGLDHVFTANMTGNVVLMGIEVVSGDIMSSIRSGIALVGFFLGVVIGWLILNAGRQAWGQRRRIISAILIEALTLAVLSAELVLAGKLSEAQVELCITLSSLAMGVQSVAARVINIQGVTTTYITGMMVSAVESILKGIKTSAAAGTAVAPAKASQWKFPLAAAVIYIVGALAGAVLTLHMHHWIGIGALVVVAAVVVISILGGRRHRAALGQNYQTLTQ